MHKKLQLCFMKFKRAIVQILSVIAISLGHFLDGSALAFTSPLLPQLMSSNSTHSNQWSTTKFHIKYAFSGSDNWVFTYFIGYTSLAFARSVIYIYFGRLLCGFEIRGILGVLTNFFCQIGILCTYVAGYFIDWRMIAITMMIFCIPTICFYMQEILWKHWDWTPVQNAIKALHERVLGEYNALTILRELKKPSCTAYPLLVAYAKHIFIESGIEIEEKSSEYYRRKFLLLISGGGVAVSLAVLSIFFYLRDAKLADNIPSLPIVFFIIYLLFFMMGFGSISWLFIAEILPPTIRSTTYPLCIAWNWIWNFGFAHSQNEDIEQVKDIGNILFQEKRYLESCEAFTRLIYQSSLCGEIKGFWNRSASLEKLNKYHECLDNLDASIRYESEFVPAHQLYDRRGRCFLKLEMKDTALENFRIAKRTFRKVRHTRKKKKKSLFLNHLRKSELEAKSLKNTKYFERECEENNLSSKVETKFSNSLGRYLVAKENFKPGEIILTQSPISMYGNKKGFCHHCLKEQYHSYESQLLLNNGNKELEIPANVLLAIRIISKLKESILDDNMKDICDDYAIMNGLVSHERGHDRGEVITTAIRSVIIGKILLEADFYGDRIINETHLIKIDKFIHFLQLALPHNIHSIYQLNGDKRDDIVLDKIGRGIYEFLISNRTIKKGDIISDCYGSHHFTSPKNNRRMNLMAEYKFECNCVACKNNYPSIKDLMKQEPSLMSKENKNIQKIFKKYQEQYTFQNYRKAISYCQKYIEELEKIKKYPHPNYEIGAVALKTGLAASVVSKWKANERFSYGYGRAEVLGGFINGLFLLFISFFILSEAVERLVEPPEVKHERLFVVSVLGLFVNLIGIFIFQHGGANHGHSHDHGHGHSHDHGHGHSHGGSNAVIMKGVFLHILADTLGSVGVIISSVLMYMFDWMIADPICSIFIAVLIALSVGSLISESVVILMQRQPRQLDDSLPHAYNKVLALEGVQNVQETHFWTLSSDFFAGGLKLEVTAQADQKYIVSHTQMIFKSIGVSQVFVQLDYEFNKNTYMNLQKQPL
ncbi:SLC30A5_7 [Lepeophtheirus salmonis]|uniref:SLC30A5_7 n=1 Tax=Lepeophtheirus salmonis TaxID=72036 RepID=A0A7R8D649_LEPSM|nr:SLC30A5_7 [Lepeophtheirus salmonis]CAF3041468.1 SLC30A5_7 [Lepeophtheirus salmonis]